ncbi:MAG: type 4a pilus biogenesis protein PilO [Balneolaceae bacterium]|nr:type 4a pilus biogenesis protein PilO [Balneolaceae bacterium]
MSYALRNTIILLLVFLLITGGGYAYITFVQQPEIERLDAEVTEAQTKFSAKQQTANQYESLKRQFESAQFYIQNFDKAMYPSSNEDEVFDFINELNTGSSVTDFAFTFVDSTSEGQFGVINTSITGTGSYSNLVNFIRKIELSKPINKIEGLSISPINNLENYGRVNFNFSLNSFYSRDTTMQTPELTVSNSAALASVYNPFFPLIRDIQPNEDNLTSVESSELVALSGNRAFLVDQNGTMQRLQIGDSVYLGSLQSINLEQQTATFRLNKGGIIERVTLEVQ